MSAQLANASADFTIGDVAVHLSCSSATELLEALRAFGKAPAANDAAPVKETTAGKPKPAATPAPAAATASAGSSATPTVASSAQAAAAPAAGEAGNAAVAQTAEASAPAASPATPAASPEVTFDALKKAFLALSTKAGGRALCEGVLKPFSLAK